MYSNIHQFYCPTSVGVSGSSSHLCFASESPCHNGLNGWSVLTWWWPLQHLTPTSCHQVLFSLFVFRQQPVCTMNTKMLRIVVSGIFLGSDISTASLHPTPSCDSLCLSVYQPQKLVASFPCAAWSPAPLLIFSKQSKSVSLSFKLSSSFTLFDFSISFIELVS